jgi:hypothetical protein
MILISEPSQTATSVHAKNPTVVASARVEYDNHGMTLCDFTRFLWFHNILKMNNERLLINVHVTHSPSGPPDGPVCNNGAGCLAVLAVFAVVAITWASPFVPWA